ncbi:MAG: hypothetical protein FWB99_04115 [Treponema sp.]|nr:hypothetical protein [Treponema sp.]
MVSRFNLIKTIALIAVIGVSTAAYGQQIIGVDTLVLTGEVYIPINGWRAPFEGSIAVISEPPGGTGVIAGGQLSFIFGRPSILLPLADVLTDVVRGWSLVISAPEAMGARLVLRTPEAGMTISQNSESGGGTSGGSMNVHYLFVDRDVTISARRRIENTSARDDREWIADYRAFNITLRTGWNGLHRRLNERWDMEGNGESTTTLSQDIPEWAGWLYRPDNMVPFFN